MRAAWHSTRRRAAASSGRSNRNCTYTPYMSIPFMEVTTGALQTLNKTCPDASQPQTSAVFSASHSAASQDLPTTIHISLQIVTTWR